MLNSGPNLRARRFRSPQTFVVQQGVIPYTHGGTQELPIRALRIMSLQGKYKIFHDTLLSSKILKYQGSAFSLEIILCFRLIYYIIGVKHSSEGIDTQYEGVEFTFSPRLQFLIILLGSTSFFSSYLQDPVRFVYQLNLHRILIGKACLTDEYPF